MKLTEKNRVGRGEGGAMDRSLTRQMGYLFIGRAVAFVFVFALPLVLVRIFSQEEFGLYKQLFLIHATLASILTFGFSASLYYFVPRHEGAERHAYVSQTLLILAGLGGGGAGLLVAFRAQVAQALNNPDLASYIPALAVFIVLSLVASVLETLMVILKQARMAALTNLCSEMLRAGVMIGVSVLLHSMMALVLAALAWAGCRFVVLLAYLRRQGMPWWTPFDRGRLTEQCRYSVPFGLAVIVAVCANDLHQYVVSYLFNPVLFALYSVGCLQIPVISMVFESVADVTLVRITELRKEGRLEDIARLMGDSVTKLGLLLFPVYVWLVLNARDFIVLLYTERFEASVEIFRVFLTLIPLAILELNYVVRAFADTGFILRVNLARLALSAALLVTLVPSVGLVGGAVATVGALGLTGILTLRKLRTLLEVPIRCLLPWSRLSGIVGVSIMAGIVAWGIPASAGSGPGGRLLLSAMIFAVCYAVLVWNTGVIAPHDKRQLMEVIRKPAGAVSGLLPVKTPAAGG